MLPLYAVKYLILIEQCFSKASTKISHALNSKAFFLSYWKAKYFAFLQTAAESSSFDEQQMPCCFVRKKMMVRISFSTFRTNMNLCLGIWVIKSRGLNPTSLYYFPRLNSSIFVLFIYVIQTKLLPYYSAANVVLLRPWKN